MAFQKNNRNNGSVGYPKKASTEFKPGMFVQIDGTTGFVEPADGTTPIIGVCNDYVPDTDATNDVLNVSILTYDDILEMPADAATTAMVGRYAALNATSDGIIVAGIATSAAVGTPILIDKVISATLIKGRVAFKA